MATGSRPRNPVGRPRRPAQGEAAPGTRDRVLDHAQALLEARGYAGMSMEDVAGAAGLTKGTLYHHFGGGKDALLLAVAERTLARHGDGLARATQTAQDVRSGLLAVANWTLGNSGRPERLLRDATRFLPEAHAHAMARTFGEQVYARVHALMAAGVAAGELEAHDTEFSTWAFLGLLSEFAELRALLPRPDLAGQIVDLVLSGIGKRGQGNSS